MGRPRPEGGVRRWTDRVGDAINARLDRAGRVLMRYAATIDFVEDLADLSMQSKDLAKDAKSLILDRPRGPTVQRRIDKLERLCVKMESLEAKYRSGGFTYSVVCLPYRRRILWSVRTIRSVIAEYRRQDPPAGAKPGAG